MTSNRQSILSCCYGQSRRSLLGFINPFGAQLSGCIQIFPIYCLAAPDSSLENHWNILLVPGHSLYCDYYTPGIIICQHNFSLFFIFIQKHQKLPCFFYTLFMFFTAKDLFSLVYPVFFHSLPFSCYCKRIFGYIFGYCRTCGGERIFSDFDG